MTGAYEPIWDASALTWGHPPLTFSECGGACAYGDNYLPRPALFTLAQIEVEQKGRT